MPFGTSSGTLEDNTDHCRAGGLKDAPSPYKCDPWCLFDLEDDASESNDLAPNAKYVKRNVA